ncbi:hypothetical protein [Pararhizobium qamdonense]|uniref:hypothetical protein n=1 Tax=Pararhizobium qamdonense TaxID=3031126 RepID=UPI0023E183F4|nr:hypothetical protein [Pararhizobium qamdonense]
MSVSIISLACGCFFAGRELHACDKHEDAEGWPEGTKVTKIEIDLVQTCGACPEQYDAFRDGEPVGYLRLRHGYFRVDYPECGGETIFDGHPEGDGCFTTDERDGWLEQAKTAIAAQLIKEGKF